MVQFGTVVLVHPVCVVRVRNQDVLQLQKSTVDVTTVLGSNPPHCMSLSCPLIVKALKEDVVRSFAPYRFESIPHCRTWIPSNLFLQPSLQKGLRVQVLEPKTEDRTAVSVKTTLQTYLLKHHKDMEAWKIIFLSKWVMCGFQPVNLPGCNSFDQGACTTNTCKTQKGQILGGLRKGIRPAGSSVTIGTR